MSPGSGLQATGTARRRPVARCLPRRPATLQAGDVFRAAVALLVRRGAWADAVGALLRFGEACERGGAGASQAKAYLSAVVVWLHAGQPQAAWQVYQDVMAVPAFAKAEEAFAADALLAAYAAGDAAGIQAVVQVWRRAGQALSGGRAASPAAAPPLSCAAL